MNATKRFLKSLPMIVSLILFSAPALAMASGPSPVSNGPSVVKVEQIGDGAFAYMVNDQPQFMVGMGYNPIYRQLSSDERAARYDADFTRLRAMGVNTIMGWDADKGYEQDKFDRLTLDKAQEHGLGVVMPFYLPADGDYTDPALREQLKAALITKVETFKGHPAIRMWGLGNEVLESVIARGQVEAFGSLYLDLADTIHSLDPNHPVIYREAEEVFLPGATWYRPEDGVERPWLLYGMNFYTFRLENVLDAWPSMGYDLPLFITEFAPDGWSPEDRPAGYLKMWDTIRSHPDFVLGAAPYAWTTEGPEPVDRQFGLVDGEGNAADESLEALAEEFRQANLPAPTLTAGNPR